MLFFINIEFYKRLIRSTCLYKATTIIAPSLFGQFTTLLLSLTQSIYCQKLSLLRIVVVILAYCLLFRSTFASLRYNKIKQQTVRTQRIYFVQRVVISYSVLLFRNIETQKKSNTNLHVIGSIINLLFSAQKIQFDR